MKCLNNGNLKNKVPIKNLRVIGIIGNLRIIKKNFSQNSNFDLNKEKPNLKDFNLNFGKNTKFEQFQDQMKKNIEIGLNPELNNITSTKLIEQLKAEGIEKTKEELEVISKFTSEKGKDVKFLLHFNLFFF